MNYGQETFERQEARKRAEICYGPWELRLQWIAQSSLVEERRAMRYDDSESYDYAVQSPVETVDNSVDK